MNSTSQGELVLSVAEGTPEDARKDGHIRGRSRPFMKHPGKMGNMVTERQTLFSGIPLLKPGMLQEMRSRQPKGSSLRPYWIEVISS